MNPIDKLLKSADRYLEQSDWKDLTLIKFCLCSMGVLIGMALPVSYRRKAAFAAGAIFTSTYIPLMEKYFRIITEKEEPEAEMEEETTA